jgi:hypothetical protein
MHKEGIKNMNLSLLIGVSLTLLTAFSAYLAAHNN